MFMRLTKSYNTKISGVDVESTAEANILKFNNFRSFVEVLMATGETDSIAVQVLTPKFPNGPRKEGP